MAKNLLDSFREKHLLKDESIQTATNVINRAGESALLIVTNKRMVQLTGGSMFSGESIKDISFKEVSSISTDTEPVKVKLLVIGVIIALVAFMLFDQLGGAAFIGVFIGIGLAALAFMRKTFYILRGGGLLRDPHEQVSWAFKGDPTEMNKVMNAVRSQL
ncbi:PH domain-containing protein [bacterium]|nr:PH domain-containing protein [bacterium]